MQYKAFLLTTAFSLVFSHTSFAQGPVGDEVMVTFDQTVQVGSHSLPAGKYTIRQVTSASNPRVLEFTSRNGTKLDATVAAVPILQNTPPSKTRVIVDNEGGIPRLSRIWVQGKSYGYEFPGHGNVGVANNAALQGTFVAQAAPAPAPVAQERTPAPAPAPAPVAQTPPPAENPVAQNRPAETPAPPPPAQAQTAPPAQTQPPSSESQAAPAPSANQNTAPSETAQNNTRRDVPATALGWMQIALLGMALASAGGVLYWRERSQRQRSDF
jgi:hypothetical protein